MVWQNNPSNYSIVLQRNTHQSYLSKKGLLEISVKYQGDFIFGKQPILGDP
jgi:hypothetical protein